MSVYVEQGGLFTTIQDGGRLGYQSCGMTPAGAMDQRSMRMANLLVGNDRHEGTLEVTMIGPTLRFDEGAVIAVTGGNLQPKINGAPMEMYRAVRVKAGDKLTFGGPKTGSRAYIAFSGGFDLPKEMGSLSTYTRFAIGGIEGRKLKTGDVLPLKGAVLRGPLEERRLPAEDFSAKEVTVRVVLGPQDDRFTEGAIETFLSTPYEVTMESDRMGYRLKGETLEHLGSANIISDGIAFGSVQVPASGQPILMMADHQPTGGYTKIAGVISIDLPLVAQSRAPAKLNFKRVTVQEAQELYKQDLKQMNEWEASMKKLEEGYSAEASEELAIVMGILQEELKKLHGSYCVTSIKPID